MCVAAACCSDFSKAIEYSSWTCRYLFFLSFTLKLHRAVGTNANIAFSNRLGGSGTWSTSLSSGGNTATGSFALPGKAMNQAILAIELYDTAWDFGSLTFTNVVITANTASTSWCTNGPANYNNAAVVSISRPTATVSGGTSTCSIASITLVRPA